MVQSQPRNRHGGSTDGREAFQRFGANRNVGRNVFLLSVRVPFLISNVTDVIDAFLLFLRANIAAITKTSPLVETVSVCHNATMKLSAALFLDTATTAGGFAPTAFVGRHQTPLDVAVGDSLHSVEVFQGFPDP